MIIQPEITTNEMVAIVAEEVRKKRIQKLHLNFVSKILSREKFHKPYILAYRTIFKRRTNYYKGPLHHRRKWS